MANIPSFSIRSPCVACVFTHRKCPQYCWEVDTFRKVISPQDYHTIFTIFGTKSVASILQYIPRDKYLETLHFLLYGTKIRIENPIGGCFAYMASLEQRLEELQTLMTVLEARLNGGSFSVNQGSPSIPPSGYLNLLMSVSVPKALSDEVDLPEHRDLQASLDVF